MNRLVYSVILFCCLFLVGSCQKEVEEELPIITQPSNGDSTLLRKYYVIDTARAPGMDTIEFNLFDYDNQKRLIQVSKYFRGSPPDVPFTSNWIIKFHYNGNDSLPDKISQKVSYPSYTEIDTTFYTYVNGVVSYDSSMRYINASGNNLIQITVQFFTGTGNIIDILSRETTLTPPSAPLICESNAHYVKTYSGLNIATQDFLITGCDSGGSLMQFTYDGGVNPFYRIYKIRYPISYLTHFRHDQKNNLTRETWSSVDTKYRWTLRSDGYPLEMRYNDLNTPGVYGKEIYYYQ